VSADEPIKVWDSSTLFLLSECFGNSDSNPIEMSSDRVYSWKKNEILEWEIKDSSGPLRKIQVPFNMSALLFHQDHLYIGTIEGKVEMFDLKYVIKILIFLGIYHLHIWKSV